MRTTGGLDSIAWTNVIQVGFSFVCEFLHTNEFTNSFSFVCELTNTVTGIVSDAFGIIPATNKYV